MQIRNMYVFSDTSAENLRKMRVCGVAMLTEAESLKSAKLQMRPIPLLIGVGGIGQSVGGWAWNLK